MCFVCRTFLYMTINIRIWREHHDARHSHLLSSVKVNNRNEKVPKRENKQTRLEKKLDEHETLFRLPSHLASSRPLEHFLSSLYFPTPTALCHPGILTTIPFFLCPTTTSPIHDSHQDMTIWPALGALWFLASGLRHDAACPKTQHLTLSSSAKVSPRNEQKRRASHNDEAFDTLLRAGPLGDDEKRVTE